MISIDIPGIGNGANDNLMLTKDSVGFVIPNHEEAPEKNVSNVSLKTTNKLNYKHEESIKIVKQILTGQLRKGKRMIELPNPKGQNKYEILVRGGKAILCHQSYNPDGHTWSTPPLNKQTQYFYITDSKTYILDIEICEIFGKLDKVYLINPSLRKSINVEFIIK